MASIAMMGIRYASSRRRRARSAAASAVHEENGHLVAVRRRERRVAVDVDLVHLERQLALDGGDDRPHLLAEVAAVPAVEGDPEHRLCRERLTPRRPSSTDDGSARQDLGAAFLL